MRWLHISDIHFSVPGYDSKKLKSKLKLCLNELNESIDFMLITGDCFYQYRGGERDQTATVKFVKELAKNCGCKNNRIYMCQGNHDVNRNDIKRNEIIKDIRDGLKDFSSNYDTLCELGNEKFLYLHKRINTYDYEAYKVYAPKSEIFRIISINTGLLSMDDNDTGKLKVCNEMLTEIGDKILNDDRINILIMHHGTEFLEIEDAKKFEHWMEDNHIDIVHCGHTHRAAIETYNDIFRDIKQFTAGALMLDSYAIPSFYIGEYDDRVSQVTLKLYTYSKKTEEWIVDNQHLRKFKNGIYQYTLSRKKVEDEVAENSVLRCKTTVDTFNRKYAQKFSSKKIYSNKYEGLEDFDAWKIIHSLVEVGVHYALALEMTKQIIDEITNEDFECDGNILSCKELRNIVYSEITNGKSSSSESEFDVSCWASRYARRYNRNEEMVVLKDYGQKDKLNCSYIKNVLLKEVVDSVTGNSIFYEKIFHNERTRMSESILDFFKNMGIFEIKSTALKELVIEYITQKPHPWLVNGNRKALLTYHCNQCEKHIAQLEGTHIHKSIILQTEAAYHICAMFLVQYDDYIGCTETSPINILQRAVNCFNNTKKFSITLPMQRFQVVQLKKDLTEQKIDFDEFKKDINIIHKNIVCAKRVTLEETKNALLNLWGIIRKLEQKTVEENVIEKDPIKRIMKIFSNAKGFLVKSPLRDLHNCFWVEPNWEEYERQQQHLQEEQFLVCVLTKKVLFEQLNSIFAYLYCHKKRPSITEIVFVLDNFETFSGETRKKVREKFKGKYIKCIFLQEENFSYISDDNGWRTIFYEIICISRIS